MRKPRVFLDSSVIVAALLSSRGGSFYVLTQLNDRCAFRINEYVLAEMQDVLTTKFRKHPALLSHFFLFLGLYDIETLKDPSRREVERMSSVVSKKDAPILASAIEHSDYLVTLDNEFLSPRVLRVANMRGLTILKPGDLIALFH